jgi:hypothetical protein
MHINTGLSEKAKEDA